MTKEPPLISGRSWSHLTISLLWSKGILFLLSSSLLTLCPGFLLLFWLSAKVPKAQNTFEAVSAPGENAVEFISLEVVAETLLGEGELLLYFLYPLCHFGLEQYLFLVHLNSAEGRGSCNMAYLHHAVSSWQLPCLSENRTGPLRMWVLLMPTSGETSSPGWEGLHQASRFVCFSKVEYGEFFSCHKDRNGPFYLPLFPSSPLLWKKRGKVSTWDQHVLVFPLMSRLSSLPLYKNKNL